MGMKISPREVLPGMYEGEEFFTELGLSRRLGTKTVASYSYKIYDSDLLDVSASFSGGSSILDNVITFGIKAAATGRYTLVFTITCAELLPDGITPYEFFLKLYLTVS